MGTVSLILLYLLSLVVNWIIFRLFYKLCDDAWALPHGLIIAVICLPFYGTAVGLLLLIGRVTVNLSSKIDFNYKKFFKL